MKKLGKISKLGKLFGIKKSKKKKAVKEEIIVRTLYDDEIVLERSVIRDLDDDEPDSGSETNISYASSSSSSSGSGSSDSYYSLDNFLATLYESAPSQEDFAQAAENIRQRTAVGSVQRYQSFRSGTPLQGPRPEVVPLAITRTPGSPQGTQEEIVEMKRHASRYGKTLVTRKYKEPKLRTSISGKSMPTWSKIVRTEFMDPNIKKLSALQESKREAVAAEAEIKPVPTKKGGNSFFSWGNKSKGKAKAGRCEGGC